MPTPAEIAAIQRWARGQELASARIAAEAQARSPELERDLPRVDELRSVADALGATVEPQQANVENLAFHLTWAALRRALGFG